MKAKVVAALLESLAKQNVSDELAKWCVGIVGSRYPDWWERKNHRALIDAKPTRPEHHRARRQLLQLAKSDLELRPDAEVEVPESLTQFATGRHQQTCEVCGKPFRSSRSDKRTCSTRCRKRQSRNRKVNQSHLSETDDSKYLVRK